MLKKSQLFLAAFALLSLVASCSKDEPAPATVEAVSLSPTSLTLVVGTPATLTATVEPSNAADKSLTWTSSNPVVATVVEGVVTPLSKGTATITATTGNGLSATCAVTSDYIVETVLIPRGTFLMGSSDGSATGTGTPGTDPNATPLEPGRFFWETQHRVTLTQDYYMSKYLVTNAQFAAFLNAAGVDNTGARADLQEGQPLVYESLSYADWGLHYVDNRWAPAEGYAQHPVIHVTWYGAKAFAEWAGGTLPSEAQWERAARGGTENMPFGIGNGKVLTGHMANFHGGYPYDLDRGGEYQDASGPVVGSTTAVGTYAAYANAYGLYDMHGNLYEWCLDAWDATDNYATLPVTDPVSTTGEYNILRGSYWLGNSSFCRSAWRDGIAPDDNGYLIGFRVVFMP
jgi:formylglycine-generating enzyme required for sulfatase activity